MKASVITIIFTAAAFFASCKKEYICECKGPSETLTAFRAKDKKKNAEQKCEDYYNQHYGGLNGTYCKIR